MLLGTYKVTKLRYLLTLFSLLCLLVLPYDAYAADQGYGTFWYGPNEQSAEGVSYIKTGVVASNKYDAALYALGFGKSTVTGISNSKKNKLIANSTFSSFASGFKTGKPDDDLTATLPGVPSIGLNTNSMLSAWYAASAMYGNSNCYWSIYSEDSSDAAYDAAYRIIKSGSSTGGGGSSSGGGSSGAGAGSNDLTQTMTLYYVGNGNAFAGNTAVLHFKEKLVEFIKSNMESQNKPYTAVTINQNNGDLNIWIANHDFTLYMDDSNNLDYFAFTENSTLSNALIGKNYRVDGSDIYLDSEGSNFFGHGTSYNSDIGKWVYNQSNVSYCSDKSRESGGGGGDDDDPEPPIEWPVQPPTPTPPEPPDPVTPDPPTPWEPIPGIDIDITGDDFQDLLDALNEHCIHLQTSINDNVSQLWQLQSELFTNQLSTFWDNLHNDLLWLGECLNFDVNVNVDGGTSGGDDGGGEGDTNTFVPFDDTSVIYWLKQIWSKLGNGISTRPIDPVVNPNGWWDWFSGLLAGLIGSLADIGLDKIGGLVDALDTLKDKFPFCIPWDIAALLGLLVSEPVTPVIEVPLMALGVSDRVQQVGSMVIDLEPYDDAWEAVRWIERIAFCVYLATRTKDFLDLLGKIKG